MTLGNSGPPDAGRNSAILLDEIRLEVDIAWQRKASLENRAFAVLTLNLAVATLYLAIRTQISIDEITVGSAAFWALAATFLFLLSSTIGAVVAVIPRGYPKMNIARMDWLASRIDSNIPFDVVFAKSRLGNLATAHDMNQWKALVISWVLVGSGLMVVGFVGVVVLNYLKW